MKLKKKNLIFVFIALFILIVTALGLGFFTNGSGDRAGPQASLNDEDFLSFLVSEVNPPTDLPAFSLLDHHGRAFTNDGLKGKWNFLFFGYTFCPEICPTTINTLDAVYRKLKRDDLGVVFISFDPARDTIGQLAEYIPYFNEKFIGVSGKESETRVLTDALEVTYTRYVPEGSDETDYQFYHDTGIFLIDPKGRLAARFSAPHSPKFMAKKFQEISAASLPGNDGLVIDNPFP